MTKADLMWLDATAQAELVAKKEVKPIELVDAAIERIEKLNPKINAVVTKTYDEARAEAGKEYPDAPFKGVPFLVKDLLAVVKGVRLTGGTAMLADFVPDYDSELVKRFRKAGFIILGKTNTPEFGIVPTTESAFLGKCRNPWNLERTTGGSSGGSAAAVASGLTAVAHANDGGGSIRIPSSCCGVFGLKPTRGRNPLGPDYGDVMSGLVCEHVVTRSVRDSAAILDITAGDIYGPYFAPSVSGTYLQRMKENPGKLRIGFTTQTANGTPVHEDCVSAMKDAAKLCGELGHHVEDAGLPSVDANALVQEFMILWSAGVAWDIDTLAKAFGKKPSKEIFEPITWTLYEMGHSYTAPQYLLALQTLQKVARDIQLYYTNYDVVVTPTLAEPPVPLGTFDAPKDNPFMGFMRSASFAPFTPICNLTGQPAMSVPLCWNKEGLPIGVHFIGQYGREDILFRLAAELEKARPWADRRPPVSA